MQSDKPTQDYKEMVDAGTVALVKAFSLSIEELFRKGLIVTNEPTNPFADLPEHIQLTIVQSAFTKGLAQCLASLVMLGQGQRGIGEKEVFSMGRLVLKHEFEQYVAAFRRGNGER